MAKKGDAVKTKVKLIYHFHVSFYLFCLLFLRFNFPFLHFNFGYFDYGIFTNGETPYAIIKYDILMDTPFIYVLIHTNRHRKKTFFTKESAEDGTSY